MAIQRDKYFILEFFPKERILEFTWLLSSNQMIEEEYKQGSLEY